MPYFFSDGSGRTGTYCLVDMVLNRMAKGAKEIDIAATLEHIRDQRMNMVKTKVNNKGGKGGFKGWVSLITWLIRDQRRNMVKTKVNNKGKKGVGITDNLVD